MSAVVSAKDVFHRRGISPDQLPPGTVELLPLKETLREAARDQRRAELRERVAPGTSHGWAQNFASGSNGSDGSFDLTGTTTGTTVIFPLPTMQGNQHSLNIYNFGDIVIPQGVTVRLSARTINGPVVWLASGNVDVEGTIDLSGQAGVPMSPNLDGRRRALDAGAGGYAGGIGVQTDGASGVNPEPVALNGDGPGGGAASTYRIGCGSTPGAGGVFSGNNYLVPLVGGSGGGGGLLGGTLGSVPYGGSGGAGGGALLIASSGTITVNGTITANGGAGAIGTSTGGDCGSGGIPNILYRYANGYGGGGSGGGIRLAANTVTGSGVLTAVGGPVNATCNGGCSNAGGNGVVRIEAFTDTFTGTITGTQIAAEPYDTFVPTSPPASITVISVASIAAPPSITGSLATPDFTINSASPVVITLQTSGIPANTVLTLHVFSDNLTDQTVTAPVNASGAATATVTFPSGYALSYIKANWTTTN